MATNAATVEVADARVARAPAVVATRVGWVDVARGFAITLVVVGHAAGGLIDAAGPHRMVALRYLFLAIYTFHMPLFFVISGMFVAQRFEKGAAVFLGGVARMIAYPYFLWSTMQFSLIFALGALVNHPAGAYWPTMLSLPWQSVSQFWFLHALLLINLLGFAAWRIGGPRALMVAALIAQLFVMFVPTLPAIGLAASHAPFFALGCLLGWRRVSDLLARPSIAVRVVIISGALGLLILLCASADSIQPYVTVETASWSEIVRVARIPAMLPATVAAGIACLLIADALSKMGGAAAAAFHYLGRMSMPIFLLHIIFVAGLRIALTKLVGVSGLATLPLLVVAGIAGPLLVRRLTDRLQLTRRLALG